MTGTGKGRVPTGQGLEIRVERRTLDDLVGYHLRRAQLAEFQHFARYTAEFGLAPGGFGLLTLIQERGSMSAGAIARALGLDKSSVTPILSALERDGLIARTRAPQDRRAYAIRLTEHGRRTLADLGAAVRRHEAAMLANFTEEERTTLIALLKRLKKDIDAQLGHTEDAAESVP